MKVLLVYPRFKYENSGGLQEPLGILYIASVLRKSGHDVSFIDLTFEKDFSKLNKETLDVDLIGMSSTTALFGTAKEVLKHMKSINPELKVAIGGPHPTVMTDDVLDAGFDYSVIGEGEKIILELLNGIKKGKISDVKGIAYRIRNKTKINKSCEFIENLDSIPFPARDMINWDEYNISDMGLIITRGCPYNCLYCKPMQNKLFGKKIRKRSSENVADEIEEIAKIYGVKSFFFKDDTFSACGEEWIKIFGNEIEKRNLKISWTCQTRVNEVTEGFLKAMKDAGCRLISFGVESGSQKILNFYRKGITTEQTKEAFKLCKKVGILTHAYIMLGAPIETEEDMEMTYQLIKEIKPYSVQVSITTPAPGTDLGEYVKNQGILNIHNNLETDYYANEYPIKLQYLTPEKLKIYRKKIYRYMLFKNAFSKRGIITAIRNPGKAFRYMKKRL
ncbi:MAG: cobalamin-dependent protein [Candidatus Aenigmarchaeota archaeon]|nr:cobalamin-dependent protein [Candidatus Aenigmarchaeota archaeon]